MNMKLGKIRVYVVHRSNNILLIGRLNIGKMKTEHESYEHVPFKWSVHYVMDMQNSRIRPKKYNFYFETLLFLETFFLFKRTNLKKNAVVNHWHCKVNPNTIADIFNANQKI